MVWLGLAVPAALTWWWVAKEPRERAERQVAETLSAARVLGRALEDRFNSFRRLAADLATDPALAPALAAAGPPPAATARQLAGVAKASGGAVERVELFDGGGVLRLGWAYDRILDDYRALPADGAPRLGLLHVQAALRAPRGATWIGASEPAGAENLALKPEAPVEPSAFVSAPVYDGEELPAGALALKVRIPETALLGPGNTEPWIILGEGGDVIFRPASGAAWVRYLPSARRMQGFEEAFGRRLADLSGESGALPAGDGLVCWRRIRVDHRREWILLRPHARSDLFAVGHETFTRIGVLWVLSLMLLGTAWWALDRRASAAAEEAQGQLLQATLNASRDLAIFATGPDGLVRFFSAGAERMLGLAAEEAVGRFTVTDFLVPEEAEEAARAFHVSGDHASRTLDGISLERPGGRRTWTFRDVADRHFPVFLSVTALRNRDGETLGKVVVAQDARPALERERRLETAAREAREAERLKSTFLAVMSHEVRTPMNGIMGMVRLLQRTKLDAEQREIAEVGERAARHLLQMLDGVLDYTKLEAGRMEIASTPFSPASLTGECAALWRLQAEARGLAFAVDAPERLPLALGDPARLRQILDNLLGNALKFTDAGEIRVSLGARLEADRLHLRWEVRDSGPGIAEEDLERIFEPFTQSEDQTTRRHGGTGLGLALARELARLMGGELRAERGADRGSRFVLELDLPAMEPPAS
jgi:signal transduction histidine kinase